MMAAARESRFLRWAFACTAALAMTDVAAGGTGGVDGCRVEAGRVVSRQGQVEIQRQSVGDWLPARLEMRLCAGDAIRTGHRSRAALFVRPENVVRLDHDTAVTIRMSDAETTVEFHRGGTVAADPGCGAAYFLARFPRSFRVKTGHVNAEIDGTEFVVHDQCSRSVIAVYEGQVTAVPRDGGALLVLRPGEVGAAGSGIAGVTRLRVEAVDQVQWVIHYPRTGKAALDGDPLASCTDQADPALCDVLRAEHALATGDVAAAKAAIARLEALPAGAARGLALRALMTLHGVGSADPSAPPSSVATDARGAARERRATALALAQRAVAIDGNEPAAHLAHSYALQATLDLDGALAAAQTAAGHRPDGFHLARVAELQLALGLTAEAESTARSATLADATEARAHQQLGFARLARRASAAAREAFTQAVTLDESDPDSRMGLGLARIRSGDVASGREDLEIAAALDPLNATIRSYLGQAYFEEGGAARRHLAADQFDLAKQRDPLDPTPWYLDGVYKQAMNRPIEALHEHGAAIERNDGRAVYRERRLLNEDLAGRVGQRGHTYEALGRSAQATQEASLAIEIDPANAEAHRSLARSLSFAPRQEVSRASEAFAARLLQRSAANPSDTRAATTNLGLAPGSEPLYAGLGNSVSVLDRDGFRGLVGGLAGSRSTASGEATVFGQSGRLSMQTGVFGYHSDGFRPNSDLQHRIGNAMVQYALTESVDLQAEVRGETSDQGDVTQRFSVGDPADTNRRDISQTMSRVGLRADVGSRSMALVSIAHMRRRESLSTLFPDLHIFDRLDSDGLQADLQHLYRGNTWTFVTGASYADISNTLNTVYDFIPPPCQFSSCEERTGNHLHQTAVYSYATWSPDRRVSVTAGASYNRFRQKDYLERESVDPKFGLRWRITDALSLRLAGLRTTRRAMVTNATLEPTQVAGFGQFYDDVNGTAALNRSIGVDYAFGPDTMLIADVVHRKYGKPKVSGGNTVFEGVGETLGRMALSTALGSNTMVGLEGAFDRYARRDSFDGDTVPLLVNTASVTPSIRWFHPRGWFSIASWNAVRQEVRRDALYPDQQGTSRFETLDLGVGWRKPGTAGYVSLEVRNALDRRFLYQDDSFRASQPRADLVRFMPVRMLWLRAGIEF